MTVAQTTENEYSTKLDNGIKTVEHEGMLETPVTEAFHKLQ
jgi:hypothetical protein